MISSARQLDRIRNGSARGKNKTQRAGIYYERKVQKELKAHFGEHYVSEPCFGYVRQGQPRICYPDGMLHVDGRLLILEIKLSHCVEAHKLRTLYEPVVRAGLNVPEMPIQLAEICRNFDNRVAFPEPFDLVLDLEELISPTEKFRVLKWKL